MLLWFRTEDMEHPPTLIPLFTSKGGCGLGDSPHNGRGTVPGSWPSWLCLVTPGTPRSVCTTQHRPFLYKVKVSRLGWLVFSSLPFIFYFFLRCQPSHGSRRGGKPIRHIINERRASAQLLGQSPCLAPQQGPSKAFQ